MFIEGGDGDRACEQEAEVRGGAADQQRGQRGQPGQAGTPQEAETPRPERDLHLQPHAQPRPRLRRPPHPRRVRLPRRPRLGPGAGGGRAQTPEDLGAAAGGLLRHGPRPRVHGLEPPAAAAPRPAAVRGRVEQLPGAAGPAEAGAADAAGAGLPRHHPGHGQVCLAKLLQLKENRFVEE